VDSLLNPFAKQESEAITEIKSISDSLYPTPVKKIMMAIQKADNAET
jgi:hypothetical protein